MANIQRACFLVLSLTALAAPRLARAQDAPGSEGPAIVPAGEAPEAAPAAAPAPPPAAPPGYAPGYGPPPAAYPPPGYGPPPAPPVQEHSGFYLRLDLGGGYTSLSASGGYASGTKISGGGAALGVALGGAVAPNLALFGDFIFADVDQPKVTSGGYTTTATGSVAVGGLGGGIVYYFEPINLYISGAVAIINIQSQDQTGTTTSSTGDGFGFEGIVGKEWWVSQHWGLGAAAQFFGATGMKDKADTGVTWSATSFNVLFSATYY
ncbi:MAG TPA: hypothetical protein VKZ18_05650 [Polyangia bacterium]|nr:hypothetical protein [Polyangia bacterium]